MKFLKENWKMLIIVIIVATLFPIIILTPSRCGTIPHDTGLTIVGYGGSILGGFLTLYGVWWTINDNSKKYYESQRISYFPILYFNKNIPIELDNKKDLIFEENPHIKCTIYLDISNIGIGKAIDLSFNQEKYTNKFFNEFITLDRYYLALLNPNESHVLKINLNFIWKELANSNEFLILEIKCKDATYTKHKYKISLKITFSYNEYSRFSSNKYFIDVKIQDIERTFIEN